MKIKLKLLDIYKEPLIYGIFSAMYKDNDIKQFFDLIDLNNPTSIDMEYYYNRSGYKTASVLLTSMVTNKIMVSSYAKYEEDYIVDSNNYKVIAKYIMNEVNDDLINSLIKQKYLKVWNNMYNTFITEFDATNPYYQNIIEKSSDNLNSKGTSSNNAETSSTYSNNDTRNSTNNRDVTSTETSDTKENRFTFDTEDENGVPYSKNTSTNNNTSTDNSTEEYTNSSEGNNSGTSNNNGSSTYESGRDISRDVERKGNIGNISVTSLLKEAIEYYKFTILDKIYDDLDGILTRSKYI